MAEFVLKYADGRGQIHQQVASAASEKELRERYSQQGFLIYSIKPRIGVGSGQRRLRWAGARSSISRNFSSSTSSSSRSSAPDCRFLRASICSPSA